MWRSTGAGDRRTDRWTRWLESNRGSETGVPGSAPSPLPAAGGRTRPPGCCHPPLAGTRTCVPTHLRGHQLPKPCAAPAAATGTPGAVPGEEAQAAVPSGAHFPEGGPGSPQGLAKDRRAGRWGPTHHSLLFSFKTMETFEDGDDLVFFYQVCEGVASASHASHTAAQAGLPDSLIARAKEVTRSST